MKSCPQCGNAVRDYAARCPQCRFSFKKANSSSGRPGVLPPTPIPLAGASDETLAALEVAAKQQARTSRQVIVLGVIYWGWPLAGIVIAGIHSPNDGGTLLFSLLRCLLLTILVVVVTLVQGVIRKRIQRIVILNTLARYVFLCGLFIIWGIVILFISVYTTEHGAHDPVPVSLSNIVKAILEAIAILSPPILVWYLTSGRAVWRDIAKACRPVVVK